jgi:transposase
MDHVAIDLGGKHSQICVRDAAGEILEEKRCKTRELRAYLAGRPTSRVILETCAESFRIADQARELGHEVRVVPATLVPQLGVGERGIKNDRRDSRKLSEVSCRIDLPSVHIPSVTARSRKTMCGTRQALTRSRTLQINCVRGWLRTEGVATLVRPGGVPTFTRRVRQAWESERATPLPSYIARLIDSIDALSAAIVEADREVEKTVDADPVCRRLTTVPGVGPVTALRFVAAVDEVSRFPSVHRLEAYLGLVPGEHSSSERQRRTGITKAGPSAVRWVLVQAAWSTLRSRRQGPLQQWARAVAERRGKRIAIVALARKLAGILFAMWRDGRDYEPSRNAPRKPAEAA